MYNRSQMRNLVRYSGALIALASLIACSGSGVLEWKAPSAPGAAAPPPNYIGTFPLTYSLSAGSCGGSSVFPTALTITATTQGTSDDGQAVTLLTGNLVGGLFDGVPLANTSPPGPSEQSHYPTAYVINSTGAIQINVFNGYAPLADSQQDLYMVVAFGKIGSANVQTSKCEEGAMQAFIHQQS